MKTKRILSMLLAVLTLCSFAGCKKSNDENDTSVIETIIEEEVDDSDISGGNTESSSKVSSGKKTPSKKGGTVSEVKETKEAKRKLDFGGKTITIMREWGPYKRGQYTVWDNWCDNLDRVQKEFNVKIVEKKWNVTLANEALLK